MMRSKFRLSFLIIHCFDWVITMSSLDKRSVSFYREDNIGVGGADSGS